MTPQDVLKGKLPVSYKTLYTDAEWREAAQEAIDDEDDGHFRYMLEREALNDRFCEWQGEGRTAREEQRREFTTLDEWIKCEADLTDAPIHAEQFRFKEPTK